MCQDGSERSIHTPWGNFGSFPWRTKIWYVIRRKTECQTTSQECDIRKLFSYPESQSLAISGHKRREHIVEFLILLRWEKILFFIYQSLKFYCDLFTFVLYFSHSIVPFNLVNIDYLISKRDAAQGTFSRNLSVANEDRRE